MYFCFLQFFPGEEHAVLFLEDTETEVWQLCVCTVITDSEHFV